MATRARHGSPKFYHSMDGIFVEGENDRDTRQQLHGDLTNYF